MKNRTVLRARTATGLVAVALTGALALAGCSSDDKDASSTPSGTSTTSATSAATSSAADVAALEKVTVKGTVGKKPTLTVPKDFSVTGAVARVDTPGTGTEIKDGEMLAIDSLAVQGSDGTALGDTYSSTPQSMYFSESSIVPQLAAALKGQKVGARVVYAAPSTDSEGKTVTYVYSLDVESAKTIPLRAEGTAVTPKSGLPTVKLDSKTGEPSITIPKGYKAPKSLVSQTLIKGKGAKVKATDSVTVQYSGWLTDGTEFDSSWKNGAPATFSLSQVVKGWGQGLAGQTVGSQVLLVIPPSLGYGAQASGSIPANSTLIFVVDILDTQSAS
ncbi:FKBP-type peptidyl-prolyl cis-trans isomerase [Luteimicrobium sp. DT211]|uniref:FKBP-type peptidyl-prolyl cis-trans isomerase n=1 Tax=Luteimicrobium sp. DT211 TaxID=3393412 RepID=UPI003CE77743